MIWPKIQTQLQPSQSCMHRSGLFYIKTKFILGFLEKQPKKIPKAEPYQNPSPLLLMPLFNCPHCTSQLCCGARALYEKQENDWTQCDIIVNGWQRSFHGHFIPILLFLFQSWSSPQVFDFHWWVHLIPHLQISHVFGIWAQGISKGFWMSSVLLGCVTESHHSSRNSDSHTVYPTCKNAQKACWGSAKKVPALKLLVSTLPNTDWGKVYWQDSCTNICIWS